MSNTSPKLLPTLRDPKDPAQVEIFQREVREVLRRLWDAVESAADIDLFTDTEDGLTPASGGGTSNFLRADGTWATPTGATVADGDYGDITVSGTGAVWNIDAATVGTTELVDLNVTTGKLANDSVTDTKLRNSAATSVIGRSAGTTGDPADIASTTNGDVLRQAAGVLGFGAIPESSVTNLTTDLAARPTGSGTSGKSTRWTGTSTLGDGAFTDNGTNVSLGGTFTLTPMTSGSVLFAGTGGLVSQDNSTFFFDDTNNQLILTAASTPLSCLNSSTTLGQIGLKGTAAASPVDIYFTDNGNTVRGAMGYGNASLADTTRRQAIYVFRSTNADFLVSRGSGTSTLDFIISGTNGRVGIGTNATPGAALDVNGINPDIFVNGSNSGLLRFHTNGISAPTFTSRGAGTKIVLYPLVGASNVDYGMGIDNNTLWMSVTQSNTTEKFKWYGGTTLAASLDGTGGLTLGSATTVAHTTSGRVTQTSTTSTNHAYGLTWTPSAGTTNTQAGLSVTNNGTFNTTSGALSEYAVRGIISSTRSSGGNNLTNVGGYFDASGGQVNVALQTDAGNVLLNQTGGTFSCSGAATFTSTLAVNGNATLGDASGDTHTLNGNITLQNAPTAGHIKVGSTQARIWLNQQIFTADGTYTPTTGCKAVRIRLVGGGGGGGGGQGAGSSVALGGGGASGAYIEKWIDPNPGAAITGGAVTIGAAGSAGTGSSASAGGTGGDTSVVVQTVTYTAKGGTGGSGMASGSSLITAGRGQVQTGSTSADFESGEPGSAGIRLSGTQGSPGNGGSNPLGAGGAGNDSVNTAGDDARGYGGGGGGGTATSSNANGGAGTAGVVIIEEYA